MPHKRQNGLAELNLIAFLQRAFGDALAVHTGAICAVFIAQEIAAHLISVNRGMQPRHSQIFQEDVALPAAPNADVIFTHVIGATGFFALPNDNRKGTRSTSIFARHNRLGGLALAFTTRRRRRICC